ncbi:hypothetical protein FJQ54_11395 [Sandaracinobacter neustonicus]|uniref:Uncharacterized protein n=1 Tax=Sandaracinobacter neustonicus TaxID=1715348 RepID=A0A501XJ56_9SPHN|nr:hypothetical protein [Sandaracinobacter neustonicus]TPE60590.1 hypothetical protein FJQ54_11395 [Sandaracinobacter neustonicus]
MFDLIGLNGEKLLVAAKSIYRLRPTTPHAGQDVTMVEYGGGYVFTLEPMGSILARIGADSTFVRFSTRSGKPVYLNRAAISRVRVSLPVNGEGTEIVVAGRYQHVTEPLAIVEALLNTQ